MLEYLGGGSDLELAQLAVANKNVVAGKKTTVQVTVRNTGTAWSKSCALSLYLIEKGSEKTAGGTFLGSLAIPEIEGKKSIILKKRIKIPSQTIAGRATLRGIVNADGHWREFNIDNNTRTQRIKVE